MSIDKQQTELTRTPAPAEKSENSFTEIVRLALIALIIVIPIRLFIAQPFIVSGASMEDTFHDSEYLIVDQITYRFQTPERGDVIIFHYPKDHSKFFIKRIIGVPGDSIKIDGHEVTIANSNQPEGFILNETYINEVVDNGQFSTTLGEDEYYVMGDNRDHSSDSRIWGVLKREEIVGRAFLRLFPPSELDLFPGVASLSN